METVERQATYGECQGLDVGKRCADCTGTRQPTGSKVKVICNSPLLGVLLTSGSFLSSTKAGNCRQQAAVKRAGAQPWAFCLLSCFKSAARWTHDPIKTQ
ncbi:hypothetical protein BDR22DRAFT_830688 [Usnea florida]